MENVIKVNDDMRLKEARGQENNFDKSFVKGMWKDVKTFFLHK